MFAACGSQPSWAAWIEMSIVANPSGTAPSQPSWAAWIEITASGNAFFIAWVAALLGCVD